MNWIKVIEILNNDIFNVIQYLKSIEITSNHEYISISYKINSHFNELIRLIKLQPRFILMNNELKLASYGSLLELDANGKNRFEEIESKIRIIFDKFNKSDIEPFFMGGFSYFDEIDDDIWNEFGSAKFILGKIQFKQISNSMYIIINNNSINHMIKDLSIFKNQLLVPKNSTFEIKGEYKEMINKENWINNINYCHQKLQSHEIEKVVMARSLELENEDISSIQLDLFQSLGKRYEGCYIFHFEPSYNYYFVGATPELLISLNNKELETVALAGSRKRGNSLKEDNDLANSLLNDIKENEEHRIVVDQIIKQIELFSYNINLDKSPSIYRIKNIQHLQTTITARLKGEYSLLQILDKLHPTPAVGGNPREKALNIIKLLEINRGWYASPIGYIDSRLNGLFIVGLRSAIVRGNTIRLYAGAGIVSGSDPIKEWNETEMKFNPIKEAMK